MVESTSSVAGWENSKRLAPCLKVDLGRGTVFKGTGALKDQIDTEVIPRQLGRISFVQNQNLVAVDLQVGTVMVNRHRETSVGGIVAGQVGYGINV